MKKKEVGIVLSELKKITLYKIVECKQSHSSKNQDTIPWLRFLNQQLDEKIQFSSKNSFPSCCMAFRFDIDNKKEFFALTFGLGGNAILNKDKIVHDFGIKVAMNISDINSLNRIQTSIHEKITTQTEKQISIGASLDEFYLNSEKEIIKKISGSAKKEFNIKSFEGKESISIFWKGQNSLENVISNILKISGEYSKTNYQTNFPYYDNYILEYDKNIIRSLDDLILNDIAKKNPEDILDIHLAPPEIIDYERYSFLYEEENFENSVHDISLVDFLRENNPSENIKIDTLKEKWRVYLFDEEEQRIIKNYKFYNCIVSDKIHQGEVYILSNGHWKKVSKNLVDEVSEYIKNIKTKDYSFLLNGKINIRNSQTNKEDENIYNEEVAKASSEIFLFDKAKLQIADTKRFEICDLLHKDKRLIQVKRYKNKSASLTYLFVQGRVYLNSFLREEKTRKSIREFIKKNTSVINQAKRFETIYRNSSRRKE